LGGIFFVAVVLWFMPTPSGSWCESLETLYNFYLCDSCGYSGCSTNNHGSILALSIEILTDVPKTQRGIYGI